MKHNKKNADLRYVKQDATELSQKVAEVVCGNENFTTEAKKHILGFDMLSNEEKKDKVAEILKKNWEGDKSTIYNEIRKTALKEDLRLEGQFRAYEKSDRYLKKAKKYDQKSEKIDKRIEKNLYKNPTKMRLRVGNYKKYKTVAASGEAVSNGSVQKENVVEMAKTGIHLEKKNLRQGERNLKQKIQYQAFHQPKQTATKVWGTAENQEGNEAVQMVHNVGTNVKERLVKPTLSKTIGFDKTQHRTYSLQKKQNKLNAKSEYRKQLSNTIPKKNKIARFYQKSQIKKEIYRKHGINKSMLTQFKGGVKNIYHFVNPFRRIKIAWQTFTTMGSMILGLMQIVIVGFSGFFMMMIPVLAVTTVLSFMFNWGNNTDPHVEMASMTKYWSEMIVDLNTELVEADQKDYWSKSKYLADDIQLTNSPFKNGVDEAKRQLIALGYIASYYQDELTETKAKEALKDMFTTTYSVTEKYINYPKWNEEEQDYEDYWVMYLTVQIGDIDEYARNKFKLLEQEKQDMAIAIYEGYLETNGGSYIGKSPFDDSIDWRTRISSPYGYRTLLNPKEYHTGIDIAVPEKTNLYAIMDAKVVKVGFNNIEGNYVYYEFKQGDKKYLVKYVHLYNYSVKVGQEIKQGQQVAKVGNTGLSTGAHLHLQIEVDGKICNPLFMIEFPVK